MTKGGRFYHITSDGANKGNALEKVVDLYQREVGIEVIKTAAIGDSENDIPMLAVVDMPFLVRKFNNTAIESGLTNVYVTNGIGPDGFSEAMNIVIKNTFND